MKFQVALTGGIGSGKSTVADLFANLGVDVIDTDTISRDLTLPGTAQFEEILKVFGDEMIGQDGRLSRDRLREKVFSDGASRAQLEGILHPAIRSEAILRAKSSMAAYVMLVVPLLVEKGGYDFADRILVVDCSPQVQIDRVMLRNGLSRKQVEAIISTQASREARQARADDLLSNENGLESLASQVAELHRQYLNMSKNVH